jgi:hypothetical protein
MQINGISTVAPIVASKSGPASTNSAKPTSAGTPTATPATSNAGSGQTSAPPQSAASALSTAASILESSTYSTSVAGKSYSANISQANGTYTLSVPNLPGASVSGSSLSVAESALSIKIDTLV